MTMKRALPGRVTTSLRKKLAERREDESPQTAGRARADELADSALAGIAVNIPLGQLPGAID